MSMMRKIILVLAALMAACDMDMCGEDKLREATSPNKKHVATLFRRGCGATTGFSYHVNILNSSGVSSSRGINEDGQVFLTSEGLINVSWKDDKTLVIDCAGCPTGYNRDNRLTKWEDINVEYQFRERSESDRPYTSN